MIAVRPFFRKVEAGCSERRVNPFHPIRDFIGGIIIGEISRARLLQFVGGLLGIASFFLPWVAIVGTAMRIGVTSTDMIGGMVYSLLGYEPIATLPTPAGFNLGSGIVTAGVLLFLAASALTLVKPFGGPLMFVGAAVSVSGATLMSLAIAPATGGLTRFIPDYGAFVGFLAATIATVGLLYHRAESQGPEVSTPPEPEPPGGDG